LSALGLPRTRPVKAVIASLAFGLLGLNVARSITAAEIAGGQFADLRARAQQLAKDNPGKDYDKEFGNSAAFSIPTKAALKTCTEHTEPPYPVNIVFVLEGDGRAKDVIPAPDQPVSACVAEKLKGLKMPKPPKADWLVAVNINIDDPGPGKVPTEFVTQVLEPTGGKILRPKDWFYAESHNGPSYTWILSREDASKAPYTTGVRIQMTAGVKKGTGKSPKKFILDFVAAKKKEPAKVVSTCGETKQGMFTRVCLETEEGPYHILYSLFWANEIDWFVVVTAGTRKDLWETYSPIFQKVGAFELIDWEHFPKEVKESPD
jgi:hypothetical protein